MTIVMLRRDLIRVLFCGLMMTSCAVIKDGPNGQITKLEKSDYKKLNGQFSNYPTATKGEIERDMVYKDLKPLAFWSQINGFREFGSKENFINQTVVLEFVSDRKAIVKLSDNGQLKKTKKIRGKIKDGYFYRRPYFAAIPLFPLVFGYKTYRYRIGLTNDSIIIDYKWNYWAFVVLAGGYSKGQSFSVFEKK